MMLRLILVSIKQPSPDGTGFDSAVAIQYIIFNRHSYVGQGYLTPLNDHYVHRNVNTI